MKTILMAGFMGDASKHMHRRLFHLLEKKGVDHFIFGCREVNDMTMRILQGHAARLPNVTVVAEDWDVPQDRIVALSMLGDYGINLALKMGADRILIHESDLITSSDVVAQLERTEAAVVGGWPTLAGADTPLEFMLCPEHPIMLPKEIFYDTWAYRVDGERFWNNPPYSKVYKPDEPFQLDSVGSVALIDCEFLRHGARFFPGAFVGLCESIRSIGGEVWCDPRVRVVQPVELWRMNDN